MRDWTKTLEAASFRGVPFQVEKATLPKSGRAVAVHRYVKSETHDTEDMGRLPREFRVTAYLASDTADVQMLGLLAACSTSGAGMLVLPIFGGNQVRCTGCSPAHEKSKLGFIAIDLDFIEAGSGGFAFAALPIADRLAQAALDRLPGIARTALSAFRIR